MTRLTPALFPVLATLLTVACGGADKEDSSSTGGSPEPGGTGGIQAPLGGGPAGGEAAATGGTMGGTGGAIGTGSGTSAGGSGGTGGLVATGGTTGGTGGSLDATGGAVVGTGGIVGTGGEIIGTGGAMETGGTAGTGGASETGGAVETGGTTGSGGVEATGGANSGEEDPVCDVPDASEFQPNMTIGGGGSQYEESDHFIVFGSGDTAAALNVLEAAHQCFVEDWCWRSPGLSVHEDDPTYYKFNVYSVPDLSAGGYMQYDHAAGLSYIEVLERLVGTPSVTVHEYGHALTLTEYGWVDQQNTGYWWESVANFVADTFITSPHCENARASFGIESGRSIIELDTVIGNSHWTICMNQNYYQAWPFLTYLTNNPDNYSGLGRMIVPELFRNHLGNNETPLHVLERLSAPITVQTILGRYWARMAYLDIEHPQAQQAFFDARGGLNFANLSSIGNDTYEPLPDRQPKYGGANIVPLSVSGGGEVSVQVTNLGNGLGESNFVATLSIRGNTGTVRYVDLPSGSGTATIGSDEEASLVVVNTPDTLYMYDPQNVGADPSSAPENTGLNYQVQITGATPTN